MATRGQPEEKEGMAQVGVEDIVHLTHIFGVSLAGFGETEGVFEVRMTP